MKNRHYYDLTWPEIETSIKNNDGLILVIGSIEQHGHHLPLGTDLFIPIEIVSKVAGRTNFLVAPPSWYGYKSMPRTGGGSLFPGTLSLGLATLQHLLDDVCQGLIRQGFKRIVVFSWHWENSRVLWEACENAYQVSGTENAKIVIVDDPGSLLSKEIILDVFGEEFAGWEIEHASTAETSLMLYLYPDLVRKEKILDDSPEEIVSYDVIPTPFKRVPKSGVFHKATKATADKGRILFNGLVDALVDVIRREFDE